ncbi:RNA polymerase sigma factor [Flavobacterium aciduliphilum]|uniref:RNA polymerase sigma-70 factor (ECF subfamily) n=1 Tax=Flavobacterium aciduliphilum TaxID=1101402 RepID=A0A328YA77_9FLAO|nr:RNA polymerase sigma factor [Flavobacterium aciduliphilum]RAR70829.1 RNA polymerase sigma-70 factor (ECF subfamily) [Flavobacterium aciduliphilum]
MQHSEEKEIIAQLKKNDDKAFQLLVDLFSKKVYNTCIGMLQNMEDAEDVTQEIFITIHLNIHQFKAESSLSTWIYRISVNKCLETIRSRNRRKRFGVFKSIFSSDGEKALENHSDFVHPGIQMENKERAAILFQAIDLLPEQQRTAYVLHKLEQVSYNEIAEIMNVSLSAVESLLFRAKQNLKKFLAHYYEENEK